MGIERLLALWRENPSRGPTEELSQGTMASIHGVPGFQAPSLSSTKSLVKDCSNPRAVVKGERDGGRELVLMGGKLKNQPSVLPESRHVIS